MAEIIIRSDQGDKAVRATVYGPLGVHQSLDGSPEQFTITHLATGYAISDRLRNMECRKAHFFARRLAKLDVWDFKRPNHARAIYETVRGAWRDIETEWKKSRSANAGNSQPATGRAGERPKQKEVRR